MAIESIGIIPDGTRRWAQREKISLFEGYQHAFKNLAQQINALSDRGVKRIHIYMFSLYNLKRNPVEIKACLDAECEFITKLIASQWSIQVIGDINAISHIHNDIANVIQNISFSFSENDKTIIYLYIGYSFSQHIESIIKNCSSASSIVETLTKEKLDFIVRTGGATTLSDFLPIESRYSQLYFLPTLFNDFSVSELMALCEEYEKTILQFKFGE